MLEYYDGALILTTNRTDSLDPAFESRIDIALTYEELTEASRKEVWVNFMQRLPDGSSEINGRDLDALAKWPLNGRQIKSAVKTARLLASRQKTALGMSHLEVVLNIRKKGSRLLRHPNEEDRDPSGGLEPSQTSNGNHIYGGLALGLAVGMLSVVLVKILDYKHR